MIILPTIGRPHNLHRFVESYNTTKATLPIHVIFDESDAHNYNSVETPAHWVRCSVPPTMRLGDIFNLIFKTYPSEDFYGMVADDVVPKTEGWDIKLRDTCIPYFISWGFDGIQNENLPVHPFIGGDLVRALGWWAAPGIKHWFVDNVWKNLTTALNNGVYLPEVKMIHRHFVNGKARMDQTYENQPSHIADQTRYIEFMESEFPNIIEKIKAQGDKLNACAPNPMCL